MSKIRGKVFNGVTRTHKFLSILSCILLTSSCAGHTNLFDPRRHDLIDQDLGLSRDDYKTMTDLGSYKKDGETGEHGATPPAVPDLAEILAAPHPPKIGATQLVSIAVTDDVPLKDVLMQLGRLANVNMEVDAGITGGVNFRAKDEPFNQVIEQISNLAGLRYSMKNNVVRVERDTPYVQVYSLDFLNLDRSASSNVNVSTSVLSSSGGGGSSGGSSGGGSGGGSSGGSGGGLDNGSSSSITSKAESDFWKQFEEGIKQIITYKEPTRVSDIAIAAQPASPVAAGVGAAAPASAAAGPATAAPAVAVSAPSAGGSDSSATTDKPFYVLNRQASTLTVSATQEQQDLIREFIRRVQANASSQVLIEAKIVEVTLDDEFQSGIDWTKLGGHKINFTSAFAPTAPAAANVATFTLNPGADLNGAVKLAQLFGATRTLASPRLHAINNQEAVMTFAQNQIYFSLNVTQSQSAATGAAGTGINTVTVTSTAHTVPIGIIMSVQPSIDSSTDEVTLSIRPTLSRIISSVTDPAVAFTIAQAKAADPTFDPTGISATVPIIEVRELDSILKLKSGQVMVIGGLMQDVGDNSENGLPGVSEIPWIGNLFKGADKKSNVSELVIFIRATIVGSNGDAAPADKDIYRKFTRDPRPLAF